MYLSIYRKNKCGFLNIGTLVDSFIGKVRFVFSFILKRRGFSGFLPHLVVACVASSFELMLK